MTLALLAELSGNVGNIHVGLAALGCGIGVGLTGLGASSAVGRNPGAALCNLPLPELARVVVRLNQIASGIVSANHRSM